MLNYNEFCVEISGPRAIFTTPDSKSSGNPLSYDIPTAAALVGCLNCYYSHPHVRTVIDSVRVMNSYDNKFTLTNSYKSGNGGNTLETITYLKDASYIVRGHIELVPCDEKYTKEYNMNDKRGVIKAAVEQLKRRIKRSNPYKGTPYFGRAECICDVKLCDYDINEPRGYYKSQGTRYFKNVFIGFRNYGDMKSANCERDRCFADLVMENGLIKYPNLLDEHNLKALDRIGGKYA